jgi:hypothetical protein
MEYDPKHKASSIASNTSSSSESTWDFPLNNYPEDDNIFNRESQNFEGIYISPLYIRVYFANKLIYNFFYKDYSALERLVVPEIDLEALEKQNTEYRLFNAVEDQKFNDFLSSFNEEVPDLITPHAKRTDDTNMVSVTFFFLYLL